MKEVSGSDPLCSTKPVVGKTPMKPEEVTEAKKIFDKLPKPQGAAAAAPAPAAEPAKGDAKKKK